MYTLNADIYNIVVHISVISEALYRTLFQNNMTGTYYESCTSKYTVCCPLICSWFINGSNFVFNFKSI